MRLFAELAAYALAAAALLTVAAVAEPAPDLEPGAVVTLHTAAGRFEITGPADAPGAWLAVELDNAAGRSDGLANIVTVADVATVEN